MPVDAGAADGGGRERNGGDEGEEGQTATRGQAG